MTTEQYAYELFKLYKKRHFIVETIVEYGPEHDFYLEGLVSNAGEELKKMDQQILDLLHKIHDDENDLFQDVMYDLDAAMNKVLEILKARI